MNTKTAPEASAEEVKKMSGETTGAELIPALEAILFAAGYPVGFEKLGEALGLSLDDTRAIAEELRRRLEDKSSGIQLLIFDDSCQLCTKEEHIDRIRAVLGVKRGGNLSRSSLETLAIVAYHQPVTRSYIDQIRGTDSAYAVNNLIDKRLIEVCGKLDAPGHPSLFRTTDDFLRVFGLTSLSALPPVELFGEPVQALSDGTPNGADETPEDETRGEDQ
ncbi:MAG: SMC-Scp complex subunit ScpB [Eubacteriales bacterium]|nr:SMC-Scp complex subunit ScpB [Clostridiales bacterium]MDD7302665.1 SMC-Scp complex subunit ScpB [Eubacteriales bacterium]